MKIVFSKMEMQQMITKYLISMGVNTNEKVLVFSIHNKNEDYLVVKVQDKVVDDGDEVREK